MSTVSCQNCGRAGHCGVPMVVKFEENPYNVIECQNCRCELCSQPIDKLYKLIKDYGKQLNVALDSK